MHRDYEKQLRNYHQAKWNEELIFDLSVPGERGVLVTPADASVIQEVGSGLDTIPASLKEKKCQTFLKSIRFERIGIS